MKKNILWLAVILWLGTVILAGCDNAKTENYDLTNEIWRQLHCYDQFKIEKPAKNYWADWLPEVIDWNTVFVEATASADGEEFRLICNYMNNGEDWNVEVYPLAEINSEEISEENSIDEVNNDEVDNDEVPVAKMRISDDLTQEEVENQINETCGNMWWTWEEGSCVLEDGSTIQF